MVKDWPMMPIGDILDFKNGLNKGKEYFGHGTPIVNYTDVYHHSGLFAADIKGTVSLSRDEIKRFEVRKGDVFFTRTSETPEEVGLSAVMLEDVPDCAFSGFVLRGRPKNDALVPEYCKYCFSAKAVREQIISKCTYTIRALTNGRVLSAIEIPVPPKDEQKAIAEALTDMEIHIANLAELIEKKKGIRDGALEDLVSGRTRLSGFTREWKNTTLGKEYQVVMGQSPTSASYNDSKVGVPLVQGNADIVDGVTAPQRYTSAPTKICSTGATIVSVRAPVGTVSRANQTVCLGRGVCAIDGKEQNYIFYLMRYCEKFWQALEQGSTFTAVGGKEVRAFEIMIPSEEKEQQAIAEVLTAMDDEIKDLEDERNKMIQIREGAMDDLLTGRVRLTV